MTRRPLTFGAGGMLIASEVAQLLRYESVSHFLRIRPRLERAGFPAPVRRFGRMLWPVERIEAWRRRQLAPDATACPGEAAP